LSQTKMAAPPHVGIIFDNGRPPTKSFCQPATDAQITFRSIFPVQGYRRCNI